MDLGREREARSARVFLEPTPDPGGLAPDKSMQIFGYGGMNAFGEFTFDMSKPDPEVTFRLINEEATELETHTFPLSQLTPQKEK